MNDQKYITITLPDQQLLDAFLSSQGGAPWIADLGSTRQTLTDAWAECVERVFTDVHASELTVKAHYSSSLNDWNQGLLDDLSETANSYHCPMEFGTSFDPESTPYRIMLELPDGHLTSTLHSDSQSPCSDLHYKLVQLWRTALDRVFTSTYYAGQQAWAVYRSSDESGHRLAWSICDLAHQLGYPIHIDPVQSLSKEI